MVAINGRSILDTLNVDKAFMGTNSLSQKHGACVADIMLAETKKAARVATGHCAFAQRDDHFYMQIVAGKPARRKCWQINGCPEFSTSCPP